MRLRWEHINLKGSSLQVRETLVVVDGNPVEGSPRRLQEGAQPAQSIRSHFSTAEQGTEQHLLPDLGFRVEAKGLEPSNLLTASQALYQLSYAPVAT